MNGKDPVSEANTLLWNTGNEPDKELARKRKRKLNYYSNILVVSDPKHPEQEGKVKLFKYGKKIFDKLMEAMQPQFEDESPVNPFDFWKGANFKLKIRKVDGYWNYDKSEFEKPSAVIDGDDKKLEELWHQQYSLAEFTSATNFKSYDELKERFDRVIAGTTTVGNAADLTETAPAPSVDSDTAPSVSSDTTSSDDDGENAMSYFEKLAQEQVLNLEGTSLSSPLKNSETIIMKRQKQSSKAEYLKKYDKSMQPLLSLGSGLVGKALLVLLFVVILMFVIN